MRWRKWLSNYEVNGQTPGFHLQRNWKIWKPRMAQDESNALNCKQSLLFDVLRARKKKKMREKLMQVHRASIPGFRAAR